MDVKIRNANVKQLPTVADMVRANVGALEHRGFGRGMALIRGGIKVYLYLTNTGNAVAIVETAKP